MYTDLTYYNSTVTKFGSQSVERVAMIQSENTTVYHWSAVFFLFFLGCGGKPATVV